MNDLLSAETIGIVSRADLDQLENHVQSRLHGRVRNFRLRLRESGLALSGDAFSFYGKQLAQHAVMKATPLPILANEIQVHEGSHLRAPVAKSANEFE